MRQTSMDTYVSILKSGVLSKRRWEVYMALFKFGPATANELQAKMENKSGVWKRLSELRNMQCVDELGERPCKITGKTCIVWDVNGKQPIPYDRVHTKGKRLLEKEVKFLRARLKRLKKLSMFKK